MLYILHPLQFTTLSALDHYAYNCIKIFWLPAMLKRRVPVLGLIQCLSVNPGEEKGLKEETISFSVGSHLKNTTVKIVHAGGRIELYQHPFPASELIQRYPGMCIAQPDIFKRPLESVLSAEDMLLPGNKYIIIRSTTVEKSKRRHIRKGNVNQQADSNEPILDFKEIKDVGDNYSEESFCSAKDCYISKESWSNCFLKKRAKEKKPFVPPIQRPRMWKESDWEPSLTSIQELSP